MAWVNIPPQFHCAVNRDGKVFLFGNTVGFAVFDIPSGSWSTTPPTFKSSVAMANLLGQFGLSAAIHPDQYTISILTTSPPTYMELDSRTMTIDGVAVPGFTTNLHGYCMDVIPTNPPTPVVCAGGLGTDASGTYTDACWKFGLSASSPPTPFATIPSSQDGCSLIAFGTRFIIFPGYLATYHIVGPSASAPNPNMYVYDMTAKSWSSVSNVQGTSYLPPLSYTSAATMPGTSIAVLYGGTNVNTSALYGNVGAFDLQTNLWVNVVNKAANPFPSPPAATPSSLTATPSPPTATPTSAGGSNTGAIAGGIAGGVVVLGTLAGFFFYKRKRSRHEQRHEQQPEQQHAQHSSFKSELETMDEASSLLCLFFFSSSSIACLKGRRLRSFVFVGNTAKKTPPTALLEENFTRDFNCRCSSLFE